MICSGPRQEVVECGPQHEENIVGIFPPDIVRSGGPEKPATHVEQAKQTDKAASRYRPNGPLEQLLNHWRRLFEDADACGHVRAQHDPQEPKLLGPKSSIYVHIV